MTSVTEAMMSEEEKEEFNGTAKTPPVAGSSEATPAATPGVPHPEQKTEGAPATTSETSASPPTQDGPSVVHAPHTGDNKEKEKESAPEASTSNSGHVATSASGMATPTTKERLEKEHASVPRKRAKLTPEQKAKIDQIGEERDKAMEARIDELTRKLKDRLRPFVEAQHPGAKDDPETKAWEAKMHREAEDLKLESFGVELLHTIGNLYIMKGTSFMKSRKMLGIPGFFSRLKEKGAMLKDAWGVIGSAVGVQSTLIEMQKALERGEVPEEELKALESDVTGKVLLASWRGTRMEVTQVLHRVCENVLREPGVPEAVLVNRAKGLLLCGAIFKSIKADESDAERRELESLVAEAAAGKSKAKELRKKAFEENQKRALEEKAAAAKAGSSKAGGSAAAAAAPAATAEKAKVSMDASASGAKV
ncbi:hypothetical protein M408DRAFT_334056 [Serendipita vermifera MAFF 305830]|uniref:DNAJ-containing protein X-domain domain-containing protein n=1 Tax=Serendipita vermifera MAFF 305830 TaxID=933852 RepID=A0A0C3ALW3_SERVB|nr:hypothetical protein M408DRAFT_334056 [Serendipita vermifera MAFF 305830]